MAPDVALELTRADPRLGVHALVDALAGEAAASKLRLKSLTLLADLLAAAAGEEAEEAEEKGGAGGEGLAGSALGGALRHNSSVLCDSLLSSLAAPAVDVQEKAVQLLDKLLLPPAAKLLRGAGGGCPFGALAERLSAWAGSCGADVDCHELHERAAEMAEELGALAKEEL